MIREVDFVDYYLPPFMQAYKEPVATLDAEQPEFSLIWNVADRIFYNKFISTADEYGIGRYEKLLKIYPSAEDTLESRRARVQLKWFDTIPYTMKILIQKLNVICGECNYILDGNFSENYTLELTTNLELYGQVEDLEDMLQTILPLNIVINVQNNIQLNASWCVYGSGGVSFTEIITGKEG